MNTIWSENVQGIMTLYLSRKLRFDDIFFANYKGLFNIDQQKPLKILEIGCGPGALAEALHRWYPNAQITGIDRDTKFIEFAKDNIKGVSFIEGDATALPFEDNSFDITISNTVQEHIEPSAFWGEQKRVLKSGGICICLSARKGIGCVADCLNQTKEEEAFWKTQPDAQEELEKFQVCRFPMSEAELPASMEKFGFTDVSTGYAAINLTPDNPHYSKQFSEAIIEAGRQCALEAIYSTHSKDSEAVISAINQKYDKRLKLYRDGIKQWDTSVSVTMVIRGRKE
ncbi:MAG: class I SAM-dependent methyltransferase [Treponema sp.]|nr:class I SAM-dependent methyltransferase [Treponema sp.]